MSTEVAALVSDNLDIWTAAIERRSGFGRGGSRKLSLYGIERLRGLILDLAVRGRLVPQVAGEEPASKLLADITVAKPTYVSVHGMPKRRAPNGPIRQSPFELPSTWEWARLGDIAAYLQRGKSPKYEEGSGVFVVSQRCVQWAGLDLSVAKEISRASLASYEQYRFLKPGDLLWNSTGTGTIGRVIALDNVPEGLVCDSHVTLVRCPWVNPRYLQAWLASDSVYGQIEALAAGSTNQIEWTAQLATSQLIPLPPLAEQQRIVGKIDELMALCDALEAQSATAMEAHQTLVQTLLATLVDSATADDLAGNWALLEIHFDDLFLTEASVDALKQVVLELAARGKLVRQDSSEEEASPLLRRIKAERAHIVASRKIRGAKPPDGSLTGSQRMHLPATWEAPLLGQIALVTDPNPSHRYPDYTGGTVPILSTQEFSGESGWDSSSAKLTTQEVWETQKEACDFSEGDIIFARKGRLGLPRFLPPIDKFTFSHTLFVIKPMTGVHPHFLLWLLRRKEVIDWLTDEMNQNTGVPTLGKAKMERLPIPLPPYEEQQRIVTRVDELTALCDFLRAGISEAAETQKHLADAIVEQIAA